MYAMRSPTCIVPASTPCPPNHTMAMDITFIIIIMTGIMKLMARLVKIYVPVSARFASS